MNNSERPVDALAVKNVNYWLTDSLKSRDASASKKHLPSIVAKGVKISTDQLSPQKN